jgi:cobalt-precorrin 5A hydrolase
MADRKAMAGLIAIGVGCRKACASDAIVALVRRALAEAGDPAGERVLFTLESKRGEINLEDAARALQLPLRFLDHEQLANEAPRAQTRSARVERHIGLPSLAETAALAGAGPQARLVVARLAADGATCAIAVTEEAPS